MKEYMFMAACAAALCLFSCNKTPSALSGWSFLFMLLTHFLPPHQGNPSPESIPHA